MIISDDRLRDIVAAKGFNVSHAEMNAMTEELLRRRTWDKVIPPPTTKPRRRVSP